MKSDDSDIDRNLMADHNYEGIRELDNPLPDWWLMIFFGTILFSMIYFLHYESGAGKDSTAALEQDMAEIYALQKAHQQQTPGATEEELLALVKDNAAVTAGGAIFAAKCAACHGALGEGLIGPNLADEYWLHGNSLVAIARVVREGVIEKGMIAWQGLLTESEIGQVSAFVRSIAGTQVGKGKAPQGEKLTL